MQSKRENQLIVIAKIHVQIIIFIGELANQQTIII